MKVVDVSNAWCSFSNGTRKKSGSFDSKCSCKEIGNLAGNDDVEVKEVEER